MSIKTTASAYCNLESVKHLDYSRNSLDYYDPIRLVEVVGLADYSKKLTPPDTLYSNTFV